MVILFDLDNHETRQCLKACLIVHYFDAVDYRFHIQAKSREHFPCYQFARHDFDYFTYCSVLCSQSKYRNYHLLCRISYELMQEISEGCLRSRKNDGMTQANNNTRKCCRHLELFLSTVDNQLINF